MSYIDLHAHVLPGVDDGAETLEASLMMLRMASEHGTKALAVTPHGAGVTKTQYLGKFERLKAAAARESLPVKLFFGMEMMADGTLFDRLQSGDVQPLGESRFLLVEFDPLDLPEFNPASFRMLGITTLRLDYGFSAEEMARLTHRFPEMRFQLNASTITNRILKDLQDAGTDFSHIDALHNFYPRRGTGLSEPALVHANILLHRYGIRVGAFVASQGRRRSPLGDGLPTLEEHRDEAAELSARHLVALGCDSVFLADSLPTDEEIQAIGQWLRSVLK